jgi:hypothetical protein
MLNFNRRARPPGGAIFRGMVSPKSALAPLAALALLLPASALGASSSAHARAAVSTRSLLQSTQLWATIDVCNAPDQPDTVGIRGSMPGNGQSGGTMYMRFRLQYLEGAKKHWVDLVGGAPSEFVAVGGTKSARQAGRSFQLVPVPGKPAFQLRGVVTFQWRKGTKVLLTASRPTTTGHQSLAGADPAGFSAATCSIG